MVNEFDLMTFFSPIQAIAAWAFFIKKEPQLTQKERTLFLYY